MLEALLLSNQNKGLRFLGEVATADFIAGDVLATTMSLTVGTAINATEPWLKFDDNGKILYIAKKPYRHSITWNNLNSAGVLTGTKTIVIASKTYYVRTISGGPSSPGTGSEWNNYLYKVSANDPTGTHLASYSNLDLGIDATQLGALTQCRDTSSLNSSNNVVRGNGDIAGYAANNKGTGGTARGWRPILELIP